jgi:hypothetical protein
VILTTTDSSPEENARKVLEHLVKRGFLLDGVDGVEPPAWGQREGAPPPVLA